MDALIADARPVWVKTPLAPPKVQRERTANLSLDENGTLEGDVTIEYTGHLAVERKLLNDDDSPVQREEFEGSCKRPSQLGGVSNIVVENATTHPSLYLQISRAHPEYAHAPASDSFPARLFRKRS